MGGAQPPSHNQWGRRRPILGRDRNRQMSIGCSPSTLPLLFPPCPAGSTSCHSRPFGHHVHTRKNGSPEMPLDRSDRPLRDRLSRRRRSPWSWCTFPRGPPVGRAAPLRRIDRGQGPAFVRRRRRGPKPPRRALRRGGVRARAQTLFCAVLFVEPWSRVALAHSACASRPLAHGLLATQPGTPREDHMAVAVLQPDVQLGVLSHCSPNCVSTRPSPQ
jgi:hypothetical protein